jgi:FAD synthetase
MVDYSNTGKNSYPLVTIQNLFVFPGIPKLLRQTFDALRPILQEAHESHHKPHVREMFVVSSEFYITDKLNALVTKYKDSVTFGSYPELTNNYYETKLTIEASDEQLVNLVVKEVQTCMDTISFDKSPTFSAMDKIEVILASCEVTEFRAYHRRNN